LARLGYEVTIFEALHQAGGVLVYGIPEFRLPKSIVEYEINKLLQLGVKIELNVAVGLSVTVDELLEEEGFDAVFVAVGAGLPTMMSLPGENLGGIYAASEYLTRANLMGAWRFPDSPTPLVAGRHVAVVGGGNVAMDAARTARRLGAEAVTVIYRRSREEMPARAEEVHHAEEEGIEFRLLCNPVRYLPDEQGRVGEVECLEMELGEPDDSGRRRPVPKQGSEFRVPADLVIVAIGSRANPILTTNTQNLELNRWGYISADDDGRTSKPRVWAGGDIVTGAATVIEAMGAGKRAAWDIHRSLSGEPVEPVAAEDT
jgi:glutamate synthase (NADPH/NADH) small chain